MTERIVGSIGQIYSSAEIILRDVAKGLPFVDEDWVIANTTRAQQRTADQKLILRRSDELVGELQRAELIVIGAPIYNFGVPATLKAWIDMVARAGVTFRYTENGPRGLLKNKRAIVVITSGGTKVGSDIDFASGYLKHVLGFVGVHDVEFIVADELNSRSEEAVSNARQQIDTLVENLRHAA